MYWMENFPRLKNKRKNTQESSCHEIFHLLTAVGCITIVDTASVHYRKIFVAHSIPVQSDSLLLKRLVLHAYHRKLSYVGSAIQTVLFLNQNLDSPRAR